MKRAVFSLLLSLTVFGIQIHAQEEHLQIAASYSILADVIANVAGDAADVTSLIPAGGDPHNFEPSPRDMTAIADADVVFVNGALFEEGLLEAIENAGAETTILEVSACVDIIAIGEHDHDEEIADEDHDHEGEEEHDEHVEEMTEIAALCESHYAEMAAIHEASHDHEGEEADEDHEGEDHDHEGEEADEAHDHEGEDHDHEHGEAEALGALYTLDCAADHDEEEADHEEEEGEHHHHGSCDPHVWTEPHNVMYWTMFIRDTLVELDPANAETYTANAEAYLETLDGLAHEVIMPMVETLPEENRVLITNHDSLGYFAHRYGFEVVTTVIPGGGTAAEPSAADIAAIIDTVNTEGVPAIFTETTVSDAIAEQIAAETGAQIYTLYTGSLSDADGSASTYIEYITYNTRTIVTALGGEVE